MPYNIYTYENVRMGAASIQSALHVLKQEDKQQFLDNLEKWDCILGIGMENQMFDELNIQVFIVKWIVKFLWVDTVFFLDWPLEHTGLDVDSYITIQPLASSFMLKNGCYENVFQISGVVQQFISRSVAGGRVVTNSNEVYHVEKKTADSDACSLYPSTVFDGWFSERIASGFK